MNRGTAFYLCLALLPMALSAAGQPEPGTLLWSLDLSNSISSSPVLAPDGTLYVATQSAFYAITNSGTTASNKWVLAPRGVVGSPAIGPDGTVYFGGGGFSAVSPDGSQKWLLPLTNDIYNSTPAISRDGTIYFAASGVLYAVTPAGIIRWQHVFDVNSSPGRILSPSIGTDGTIYIGGLYNHVFYAISPNGSEKWHFSLSGPSVECAAIAGDGTIYIGDGYQLHALAPDGTLRWQSQLRASGPAIVGGDGTLFVANNDFALYSLASGGETNWQVASYSVPFAVPTTPAIAAGGTIYYCVSNAVFAIASDGTPQWVFKSDYRPDRFPYEVITSPTIGPDGTIYTAAYTTLYAIAGTNKLGDTPWPMYHQNPRHTGKVEKPFIQKPQKRSDGGFQFQLYGQLGDTNTLQASPDLFTWTSLTDIVITNVPMDFIDYSASNFTSRFYRSFSQ